MFFNINVVANYYKPALATVVGNVSHQIANPWSRNGDEDYGKWYIAENVMEGSSEVTNDNWKGVVPSLTRIEGVQDHKMKNLSAIPALKLNKPWPAMEINQQIAEEAYKSVLENAGAVLPNHDVVDKRIIDEVRNGYATYEGTYYKKKHKVVDASKKSGIIDTVEEVGGWPELKSLPAPTDTDGDGMPDDWEIKNRLDPNNPDDRNIIGKDGYTMLEVYLNSIK